ncbi:hypothetical protein PPEP_a2122 [Pseudoalteromonas peptidolytica F12-50-A1]|uniref:Uncharacterized protein n=1 Tax=Pseudoalteromonas peptidolytica F12-50-A1 TaxID=1315280 RepID=A0A8I0T5U1_9GAMM|nr:hypothetical protein [Pseudoalteromonas peptidolytica F12-50-A1]
MFVAGFVFSLLSDGAFSVAAQHINGICAFVHIGDVLKLNLILISMHVSNQACKYPYEFL